MSEECMLPLNLRLLNRSQFLVEESSPELILVSILPVNNLKNHSVKGKVCCENE